MAGADVRVIPERAEAIRYAVCHARPGDIILLAGKGHEQYEINKTGKHPFHEREIAMRALEKD
jgi:UDP-N-acetylmuramoyl-L-alanyl-D-glutamate--2,6-diaminopimelate ligase